MDTTLLIIASSENGDFKDLCSKSCSGIEGAHGECCNTKNKNMIIGPVTDPNDVIERLQKKFPGITYADVFIDFEEGKTLYPEKSYAQDEHHYPAYRTADDGRCIFYKNKGCSIQQEKSIICKQSVCNYLRKITPIDIPRPFPEGIPMIQENLRGVIPDDELISYD